MIIWSGWGILVLVFGVGFSLIGNLITNSATGGDAYWNSHGWPLALSLLLAGAACSVVGGLFQRQGGRVLIDPKTGQQVVFRRRNSLFFIPMIWWGPIFTILAVVALFGAFSK